MDERNRIGGFEVGPAPTYWEVQAIGAHAGLERPLDVPWFGLSLSPGPLPCAVDCRLCGETVSLLESEAPRHWVEAGPPTVRVAVGQCRRCRAVSWARR